jgi:hypothetical protein
MAVTFRQYDNRVNEKVLRERALSGGQLVPTTIRASARRRGHGKADIPVAGAIMHPPVSIVQKKAVHPNAILESSALVAFRRLHDAIVQLRNLFREGRFGEQHL